MACTERRFFGIPVIEDSTDELADRWGGDRTDAGLLVYADRLLVWRLIRSRTMREFLAAAGRLVPVNRGIARQIRVATGCSAGPFPEFQSVVRILSRAETDTAGLYLVARSGERLQRVEQNVRATFPQIRVVGRAVFHPGAADSIATAIRKAGPRICLVGDDSRAVMSWLAADSASFGPVLTIVATRAAQRMAGAGSPVRLTAIPAIVLRLFIGPVLLGHRLLARRRLKTRTT